MLIPPIPWPMTIHYSLLIYPKLILLWSVPDRLTDWLTEKILHPLFPKLFFSPTEHAGPYPQTQLYWAGRTVGWIANWTRFMVPLMPAVASVPFSLNKPIHPHRTMSATMLVWHDAWTLIRKGGFVMGYTCSGWIEYKNLKNDLNQRDGGMWVDIKVHVIHSVRKDNTNLMFTSVD
jgi:hypothetical protein